MEAQLFFREAISTDVQIFGWSRKQVFSSVSNETGNSFPSEYHVFRIFEIPNFPRDNVQRNLLEKREHMIGKLERISETMLKCGFGTRCFFCISG